MQEDPQVNYDVLLQEQLKEFYLLQPEQATLSDNYYFLEKKEQLQEPVPVPYQPLRVRPEPQGSNPFRVRSKSPDIEILPAAGAAAGGGTFAGGENKENQER